MINDKYNNSCIQLSPDCPPTYGFWGIVSTSSSRDKGGVCGKYLHKYLSSREKFAVLKHVSTLNFWISISLPSCGWKRKVKKFWSVVSIIGTDVVEPVESLSSTNYATHPLLLIRSQYKEGISWEGRAERKWLADSLAAEKVIGPLSDFFFLFFSLIYTEVGERARARAKGKKLEWERKLSGRGGAAWGLS